MPTVNPDKMISDEEFERIYRENYDGFLRYAANILKTFGSNYVSVSGRAEEAVQETAAFAWEHREKLASAESPVGWMYTTLYYKVRELLREDRVWTKRMMQISEPYISQNHADFRLKVELETILSPEDYLLLKHLYLDGYTYSELCAEMGLKPVLNAIISASFSYHPERPNTNYLFHLTPLFQNFSEILLLL